MDETAYNLHADVSSNRPYPIMFIRFRHPRLQRIEFALSCHMDNMRDAPMMDAMDPQSFFLW